MEGGLTKGGLLANSIEVFVILAYKSSKRNKEMINQTYGGVAFGGGDLIKGGLLANSIEVFVIFNFGIQKFKKKQGDDLLDISNN
jgi:hypothetical protein